MKKFICFFLILGLLFSVVPSDVIVHAQENPISLHLSWVDTTDFPTVTVHLSAWDSDGLPLGGLESGNFILQEDGGPQLASASLDKDTDAPVDVALVLDISRSMTWGPLDDAKAAATRFVDRLGDGDRAAIIAFAADVDSDPGSLYTGRELDFTSDIDQVYNLIESMEPSFEKTHLYNAATKAVRLTGNQPEGHRAILLLSDGRNDPADLGDPDEAIELARESNIPVFVVGLGDTIDEPYLRRLANQTGGLFRFAPTSAQLGSLFTDMATLLKTQYTLTYESKLEADGGIHELTMVLNTSAGSDFRKIEFGPLPLAESTDTPTPLPPTSTSEPTETPEPTIIPPTEIPPTETPEEVVLVTDEAQPEETVLVWLWWLGGGLVLIVGLLLIFWIARKRKPGDVCAKCGFDLTDVTGSCPQCGSNDRLPEFKR